ADAPAKSFSHLGKLFGHKQNEDQRNNQGDFAATEVVKRKHWTFGKPSVHGRFRVSEPPRFGRHRTWLGRRISAPCPCPCEWSEVDWSGNCRTHRVEPVTKRFALDHKPSD